MRSKKLLVSVAILTLLAAVGIPWLKHHVQRDSLWTDLGSVIIEYDLRGEEKFRQRLDEICRRNRIEPDDADIRISKDPATDRITVEIEYVSRQRVLGFRWERPVTVRRETVTI